MGLGENFGLYYVKLCKRLLLVESARMVIIALSIPEIHVSDYRLCLIFDCLLYVLHRFFIQMGINNDTHVVVYDNNPNLGFYSTGRVWWMFKVSAAVYNPIKINAGKLDHTLITAYTR